MFAAAASIVALVWFVIDLAIHNSFNWLALFLCLLAAHLAYPLVGPGRRAP